MFSNMNIFLYETHKHLGIETPPTTGSRGRRGVIPRHSGRNGRPAFPLPVTYQVSGQLQAA